MLEESKRDFSGASHSTTLSDGLPRALSFAPSSRPPSPTSQRPTDVQPRIPSPAPSENPSDIIRRQLSCRSVVSTTSSFAERRNRAKATGDEGPSYRIIGLGSCGSVFEIPGTEFAIKKGKDEKSLWNDLCLTNAVYFALQDTRDLIQDAFPENTIPRTPCCNFFRPSTSKDYWETNLKRFPASHREVGAAFQVDRILPLPQSTREALIDQYFDDEIKEEAKNDEENKACLIRIYLGEEEDGTEEYVSLRNFPMRLNIIRKLGFEKEILTDEIAIALAMIHWQAQVDAMDAEFVLGSARATLSERRRGSPMDNQLHEWDILDFTKRSIHVWVLDFDKSSHIELTPYDVENYLVPAFLGNDPYYPRPDVDAELWTQFSKTYLKASRLVLRNKQASSQAMNLPKLFLRKVASTIKEHEDWNVEDNVVFG